MLSIPITDDQFASLVVRLRTNGIDMVGDTGTLTKDGVTAQYTHANGALSIEITDRPFYYPISLIETKLQSWLEQSLSYDAGKSI
jgi:hypothetical protein